MTSVNRVGHRCTRFAPRILDRSAKTSASMRILGGFSRHVQLALCAMVACVVSHAAPNFVIILADDLGFGDVAWLNEASRIPTPSIDALARGGMTFTDAHSPSAVCTPTRYGLLTGRYAWRTRLKRGVLNGYGQPLLARNRMTLGTLLRQQGYRTAIVGKWHLGLGFARDASGEFDFGGRIDDGPHTHGFDESLIIPASLDFPPYVYIRDGKITGLPLGQQPALKFPRFMRPGELAADLDPVRVLDDLAEEASAFIKRQSRRQEPFLLYLPLTAPHKPVWPGRRFESRTDLGPYGDFILHVDSAVGVVTQAIEESGVASETFVLLTSDNGSFMYRRDDMAQDDHTDDSRIQAYRSLNHTSNYVFRGTKADIWEAGHRVPFFVRWPGVAAPSSRTGDTVCLTDVFATLAEITGSSLPANSGEDSFSFVPTLRGLPRPRSRAPVIHHSSGGMFAIRDGRWKLIAGNGSGGREKPAGKPFERPYQLFDLQDDPSEKRNVRDQHPVVANRLEQALDGIIKRGRSR